MTTFTEHLLFERFLRLKEGSGTVRATAEAVRRHPDAAATAAAVWGLEVRRAAAPETRLVLLSVCDEILTRTGDKSSTFSTEFAPVLHSAAQRLASDPTARRRLSELTGQWGDAAVLPADCLEGLRSLLGPLDPPAPEGVANAGDGPSPAAPAMVATATATAARAGAAAGAPTSDRALKLQATLRHMHTARLEEDDVTAKRRRQEAAPAEAPEEGEDDEDALFVLTVPVEQLATITTATQAALTVLLAEAEARRAAAPAPATPPPPTTAPPGPPQRPPVSTPAAAATGPLRAATSAEDELTALESHQLLLRDIIRVRSNNQSLPAGVLQALPQLRESFPDVIPPNARQTTSPVELSYLWAKFDSVCRSSLRVVQSRLAEKRAVVERARGASSAHPAAAPHPTSVPFSLLPKQPPAAAAAARREPNL